MQGVRDWQVEAILGTSISFYIVCKYEITICITLKSSARDTSSSCALEENWLQGQRKAITNEDK